MLHIKGKRKKGKAHGAVLPERGIMQRDHGGGVLLELLFVGEEKCGLINGSINLGHTSIELAYNMWSVLASDMVGGET